MSNSAIEEQVARGLDSGLDELIARVSRVKSLTNVHEKMLGYAGIVTTLARQLDTYITAGDHASTVVGPERVQELAEFVMNGSELPN